MTWGRIYLSAGVLLSLSWAAPAAGQSYIGAERCKGCHEFAYRIWSAGPHAKAHDALSQTQLADPKCNTCHTMLPAEPEARFRGVQCERCHGPGRYYHRAYVMKDRELSRAVGLVDPKPEHCMQCHTEGAPSIRPFDFASMWERIGHGKAAREKLERQQGKQAAIVPGTE